LTDAVDALLIERASRWVVLEGGTGESRHREIVVDRIIIEKIVIEKIRGRARLRAVFSSLG